MFGSVLLLVVVTLLYAGYNLLVKVSSTYVPSAATSTVLATILLQLAALGASLTFASFLLMRGGHVLKLSTPAYSWALGAGLCIGMAEIAYFYLFRGVGDSGPVAANVAIPIIVSGTVAVTALVSYFVLNEGFGPLQIVGTGLVIGGVALIFFGGQG